MVYFFISVQLVIIPSECMGVVSSLLYSCIHPFITGISSSLFLLFFTVFLIFDLLLHIFLVFIYFCSVNFTIALYSQSLLALSSCSSLTSLSFLYSCSWFTCVLPLYLLLVFLLLLLFFIYSWISYSFTLGLTPSFLLLCLLTPVFGKTLHMGSARDSRNARF